MNWRKSWFLLLVAIVVLGWVAPQLQAATPIKRMEVVYPLKAGISPPLRDLVPMAPKARTPYEVPNRPDAKRGLPGQGDISAVLQTAFGTPNTPDPGVGWVGLDVFDDAPILGYYLMPPDTQGDIGKDHYIQWINSIFAVWDKTGTKVYPADPAVAVPGNILWTGFGGQCEIQNDGDPITLWDPLAERWVMSQFAVTATPTQCVAVSTTSDPTGTWALYAYAWPNGYMNDYPKLGVWSDAYYITSNNFTSSFVGVTVGAFDRAAMLAASPTAAFVHFELAAADGHYSMLPADLDGLNAPPAGAPGLFVEEQMLTDWDPPLATNELWVFEFDVDWANPAASTFGVGATHTPNFIIPIAAVGYNCSGRDCVPQPGSSQRLDDIDGRLMHRLAYRNFGTHQAMVASMTVDGSGGNAGIWWGELQDTGSGWGLYQEGVWSPADDIHRWMPSIAQDTNGNIMMVYSASASTITYPAVRYVGRLAGDPLGEMGDEKVLAAGAQSQAGGNRWGDYSMISVDPADDCTFWMTGEYVLEPPSGSVAWNWNTFIGAAKFGSCSSGPAGIVEGYVKSTAGGVPIQGASVHVGPYGTSTNASGFFQITVPVGTYDVTAEKFGYSPNGVTGVEVTDGNTTNVGDILLTPVGSYFVDGFVTAADHHWPLWARIDIKQGATLITTTYTSPWNGYYEVELANGYAYDFTVHSMYVGYLDEVRPVTVAAGDQTQNFTLAAAAGNPAYTCFLQGGINENFDGDFPPLGWTVRTLAGPNNIWKRNDVWGRANLTGGAGTAAAADSDRAGSGSGPFDTELLSPPIKMPAAPRNLRFKSAYTQYTGQTGTLAVSVNGGAFTNLLTITTSAVAELTVDMTAYANQTITLRWKFVSPSWAYYWQVDDVRTETIPLLPLPTMAEAFEAGVPPAGWSQVDNAASGVIWKTNVDWGRTPNPVSGGTGMAAGCDVDKAGSGKTYDCALMTSVFSVDGLVTPTLSLNMNYNDISTVANRDFFDIDLSTDGGTTWASLAHYNADQTGTRTFDLTGLATGTNNMLRFRYYTVDLLVHWDWYAYIDDVTISSAPPPVAVDNPTLTCETVAGSMVAGFVTDANSTEGIVGATVVRDLGGMATTMGATGNLPVGFYYMFSALPMSNGPSTRTFTASKDGYGTVEKQVILVPDTINRLDFALPSASLSLADWPFVIDGRLTPDGEPAWDKTDDFSILNNGGMPAYVKLMASSLGTGYVPPMPKQPRGPLTMAPEVIAKNPYTLKGAPRLITPNQLNLPTLAAGDVLASWPTGLALAWGCGITDDNVWASNPSAGGGDDYNYEFTGAGALTGRKVQAVFGGSWAADMTRADNAGMLWQVNVGGDNCIYEVDPNAGMTGNKICPAFGTSERGLAYDPDTDTFFAGGWNDFTVFRFDRTGAILQQVNTGLSISGLAYNPSTQHLFVMVNDTPNPVVVLDVANGYTPIGSFTIAGFGDYSGSGLEFGCDGLWAMNQTDGKAYLVDAGEMYPCNANLPWFVMTPTEGPVPAGGQLDIHAEFFPEGVDAAHFGLFRAVINSTNDTPVALPAIPVYFTKAFWDVPRGFWADPQIHALAGARITKGCGAGNFCPDTTITRASMAIQMVRALHGPDFVPPPAIGVFADVIISDTDTTADYIEQLYNDGIVAGCSVRGAVRYYCPDLLVDRAQMAVFVGKGLKLTEVVPPTGYFIDVHGTGYAYAEGWIESIFNAGITVGCGNQVFCPGMQITRAQLAVWLVKGLGIPYYTHPVM